MLALCPYLACNYYGVRNRNRSLSASEIEKRIEHKQKPATGRPLRTASLSDSTAAVTTAAMAAAAAELWKEELDEELNNPTAYFSDEVKIYSAGFGDGRAPCWTAARLWPVPAVESSDSVLYAGLFDAIGGSECARAVAALSADYAAVAHLRRRCRDRQYSCCSSSQRGVPEDWFWPIRSQSEASISSCGRANASGNTPQPLATHLAGAGLLVDRLPADLLHCHEEAIDRLLADNRRLLASASSVEARFGRALHQLDADLCCLTLPDSNDPCYVPLHSDWARRLACSGAVGTAVAIETPAWGGRRCLRVAQVGDSGFVVGSATGDLGDDGWAWRQPVAPHTIENGREVQRLTRRFREPTERAGLFAGNCFLGEQEATRAFGRVDLKWTAAQLASLDWKSRQPAALPILQASLTGEPEVQSVTLAPTERLVLLGSPALWRVVEPGDAVACVGACLKEGNPEGCNPALELLRLARSNNRRRGNVDDDYAGRPAVVVLELSPMSSGLDDGEGETDEEETDKDDEDGEEECSESF